MAALGKFSKKKKAKKSKSGFRRSELEFEDEELEATAKVNLEQDGPLTDLDKLYMALAEVGKDEQFHSLCFGLGVNSLSNLEDYSMETMAISFPSLMAADELADIKEKIKSSHFNFDQLAQKYKRSNVLETCRVKGIPVIQKQDVAVTKFIALGATAGYVYEAQWTKPDGIKQRVCLRYSFVKDQPFLQEAEIANVLRHKNILTVHGMIIASSYSSSFALVVEYAEYGNLSALMDPPTIEELCRYTIQAAAALEHLESKNIFHLAVKSYNCMVVSKDKMKLSGLGFCQYETEVKKKAVQCTQKDVVYQFATLFCAVFVRYTQWFRTNHELTSIFKGYREHHQYPCPSHFCDVFDRCMQQKRKARPSFKEIREYLVAQKFPSKVIAANGFDAEAPGFISCRPGEVITLIAKDQHRKDHTAWLGQRRDGKIGFFRSEHVKELPGYDIMDDSFVPPEIRARGPEAELAFQKAMHNGKVKVYRGRIMFLGQDRAGKTSLKKSLLGMSFNPEEESTNGIEVDPSKCEVNVDLVKNWQPTKDKKLEVSEFAEDIAMLIAKDLSNTEAGQNDISQSAAISVKDNRDELDGDKPKQTEAVSTAIESTTDVEPESFTDVQSFRDKIAEESSSNSSKDLDIQFNVDTNAALSENITDVLIQYLQGLKLEDDVKAKEVILSLWDFAGQHLYYASHPVFLSPRAVYLLVYNLSRSLSAKAEPCVRQGIHDILLDNPNSETNLDNLLAWLVSVHSMRGPASGEAVNGEGRQGAKLPYRRPPVLIVGTHADRPFEDPKEVENCIERAVSGKTYEEHVIRPFFVVDNTKSHGDDGIQKLRKKIMDVLEQEPYIGEEVPLRWFNFEKVIEALVAKRTYHMTLDQVLTITRNVCRIDNEDELTTMLNFYHDLGVIVKHGQTVVLQAQWLINVFKQLITVPPFKEIDPVLSKCWRDLEQRGVLRMTLVDHIFTDFIQKGLFKQDILDMMELYGLIGKFSCASSMDERVHEYFVPAQLTSSPSGLNEIQPSESDPCPLYLHFPDGFVPHGFFSQLLSRFINWCSKSGIRHPPQLYNNGARLFIRMCGVFDVFLVCKKRFIKLMLKMKSPPGSGSPAAASTKMASEVRSFLEDTLRALTSELTWLWNLQYELCVACCHCLESSQQCAKHKSASCSHDDCLHLLRVHFDEEPICTKTYRAETMKVNGLEKWFQAYKTQNEVENKEHLSVVDDTFKDYPSFKCGTPSTDDLLLITYDLASSWKKFGQILGLDGPQLEQIEEDERKLIEKSFGVLRTWLESCGSAATYQCLSEAFSQMKRTDLAAKYCNVCMDPFQDYVDLPPPPSLKTGTPSNEDLLSIASEFCNSWKMFCRALHLTESALAQIEENERDMVSKCYAALRMWTRKFGSKATYQRLVEVLQHPVVGHRNLADKYCHFTKATSEG